MVKRNSNIEAVRILAIFIIILAHICSYTIWNFEPGLNANRLITQYIQTFGKVGVNLFILISGYFSIDNKGRSIKSIAYIWKQVLFYSISIFIFFFIVSRQTIEMKDVFNSFFPILTNANWFATAFIILMFLEKYINMFLNLLNKEQFKNFLLTSFIIFFLLPQLVLNNNNVNNVIVLIFIYSLGAFIKKFNTFESSSSTKIFLVLSITNIAILLSIAFLEVIGEKVPFVFGKESLLFTTPFNIFSVINATAIFLLAIRKKYTYSKIINMLASTTFGIYLFHENILMRSFLWEEKLNLSPKYHSLSLIFYIIVVALTVFAMGCILDLIRQKIFNTIKKA